MAILFFEADTTGLIIQWNYDLISNTLNFKSSNQITDQVSDTILVKIGSQKSELFIASANGMVYQMSTVTDTFNDIIQLDQAIKNLLHFGKRNRLVLITESLILYQYSISTMNEVSEISKIKLSTSSRSTQSESLSVLMIDDQVGLIAICMSGERVVRLWQLDSGHNAAVIVAESVDSHWAGVTALDFIDGLLAAGTSNNHVIIWKRQSGLEFVRMSQIQVKSSVKFLTFGRNKQIACTTNSNELYIIEEQSMSAHYNSNVLAIQVQ